MYFSLLELTRKGNMNEGQHLQVIKQNGKDQNKSKSNNTLICRQSYVHKEH